MKKYLTSLFLFASLFIFKSFALADTVSVNFENPPFTIGNINGQDGWLKTGPFDVSVVTNTFGFPSFGNQSLRTSDAITSGSFGDQLFSKPLTDSAGESASTNGTFSRGTIQPHFEIQFDIASVLPELQSGMHVSVSPDRGDGSRMSYLRFDDQADGIHVYFDDVADTGPLGTVADFIETDIATISRTPHTIKMSIDFIDGPGNDVVKVWIDGDLKITGTTWEDYYRYDPEANAEQSPRIVKTVLFRESGTANVNNSGSGFLIDNLSISSGPIPTPAPTSVAVHIFKYIDGVLATTQSANSVNFPMFTSTYNAPFTLDPAGWTNGDLPYEASTGPMSVGSAYSAEEKLDTSLVGATCDGLHQYSLTGYSTGNSLSEAELAQTTTTVPTFTNLTSDKYIIVRNQLCPPVTTLKVHILKFLDGAKATSLSANNYLFPMTATWQSSNLNGGISSSGEYVLGNNFGGASDLYGADTASMTAPADYTTSELTNVSSAVVSNLASCTPGKYLLNGYRTSSLSFAAAALNPLTAIAPVFSGLTTDRYVIVDNSHCPEVSSISGQKYKDLNRNGKKDSGEPGLSGWVIRLKHGRTTITTVTDSNGNYTFNNLIPGKYIVRETHQKGWKRISKNPKPIIITTGSVVADVNFGNAQKYRFEREDDDRDDDRDDERGEYSPGRGHRNYERDSRH